jgi:hypothetical protein
MATAQTVSELLKQSNIHYLAHALKAVKLDEFFAGQIPRWVSRTGLANSATQILYTADGQPAVPVKQPFQVMAVNLGDNTPLAIVNGGVGAGEVGIAVDADGVPTFTFAAAQTSFKVYGCPLPGGLSTILANPCPL